MKASLQQLTSLASAISLALLQGATPVNGHYGFPFVEVNGVMSERFEYSRPTQDFAPFYDYAGQEAMCGPGATTPRWPIKTLKVEAGSVVRIGASSQQMYPEWNATAPFNPDFGMYHDGPASAYLSRAPDGVELNDYKGDGDWFKIASIGATDGLHWDIRSVLRLNTLNFTIPKTTPPGKYLFRTEHLNIMTSYSYTQMFLSCTHLEISGPGGGTPSPVTKFPGAFSAKDPGIWLPSVLDHPIKPMEKLKNWVGAGPAVWTG